MRLSLLFITWLVIPVVCFSATLHVPAVYPTVQEAVDAAVYGDTVLVAPGTYDGNVHFLNSGIALKSSHGPHETMLRGDSAIVETVWIDEDVVDVELTGFTITSTGGDARGVFCHMGSDATIKDNIITGNIIPGGGAGIYCYFSSPMIKNNLIYDNTVLQGTGGGDYVGGGIFLVHASPTIMNCTICDNSAPAYGGGIASKFSDSQPTIINSIIWRNTPDLFYNFSGGNPQVSFCIDNTDPLFTAGPLGDYYLSQIAAGESVDSPAVETGSDTSIVIGLDTYWTRTDEVVDADMVDIGFHYGPIAPTPTVNTSVGKERIIFNAMMNSGSANEIFSVNPDGSDLINLTARYDGDTWWTRLSPDGTKILFLGTASGSTDIWWMYSDGSCPTQVTSGIGVNWPQWYDNDTLLYTYTYGNSTGDIYTIDIDGTDNALLIDQPDAANPQITQFAYSWSTRMLIFAAQTGSWGPSHDLYMTEVPNSSTHGAVTEFYLDAGDDHDDGPPAFSPDGQTVYWVHCMNPGPFPNDPAIVYKAIDSANSSYDGVIRPATGNRVNLYGCSLDGENLLFSEPDCLFKWDLSASQETALQSAYAMGGGDWAQLNVERILYTSELYLDAEVDIFSMHPDGSGVVNLTADYDGEAWWPHTSPDGTKILFLGDVTGECAVWWMNSDGSSKTQVTSGIGVNWPQWYDDDTMLYTYTYGNGTGDIYTIDIDGSNNSLLIDQPDSSNPQITHFAYSWDTHMLVFVAQVGSWGPTHDLYITEVLSPSTYGTVYDFYLDASDDHDDFEPVFSPDSQTVYWMHCIDTGAFPNNPAIVYKEVNSMNSGYDGVVRSATGNRISLGACSPDGAQLLYSEYLTSAPDRMCTWDIALSIENELCQEFRLSGSDWSHLYHAPEKLMADRLSYDKGASEAITYTLNAGPENAGRKYLLLASATGTSPGTALPGGYATLPMNWDLATEIVLLLLNGPACMNFLGTLDANGEATAVFNAYGGLNDNLTLHFAYALNNPFNFASNPVCIHVVDP